MTGPAFALQSVGKRYGALTALTAVSLEGLPGECLALVGHNGAGKTTLMKLLLGLVRPSEGTVLTLGADPTSAAGDQARFQLGFLPETIAFDAAMTGREVLAFYARLKRLAPSTAEPLLERVGLAAAAGRRVGTYSKGMRQRLGLAQALLGRPRLLLLDEPTTGLDPELRRSFYELIGELTRDGVTVLLSSHALSEMEARTDRVAILERGRLIACGSLADLRRQARLPVQVRITVPLCQTGRVAERLGHGLAPERLDERTLVVACPAERKMELLRTAGRARPADRGRRHRAAGAGRAVRPLPGPGDAVVTPVAVIALQEVKNGLRNRWVLAATLLLAVLALSLTLLGSAPTGAVKVSELTVTVVSLASLTVFLVPLIALLLAYDAIVGEAERGTLLLLLAYPVARHQVLLGKFLGHLLILVVATVLGYGAAGLVVGLRGDTDPAAWAAFGALLGSSILLGAAFLAIGYLLSTLVRERATAGGMALGIWLLLVIVYDTALLGLLVADGGRFVTPGLFGALLLLNPSDAFRLLNLAGFADARLVAGLAGVDAGPAGSPAAALGALAAWVLLPLGLAGWLLARREI